MAVGEITKLDTLEWSSSTTTQAAVEVRDGIIAVFFDWTDVAPTYYSRISCATFSYDANGNLTKLDEQTLTGTGYGHTVGSAVKITDGVATFTYYKGYFLNYTNEGMLATVSIAPDGTIIAAVIDSLEFESSAVTLEYIGIAHAIGDIYVISYLLSGEAWIVTVDIDSAGNIGAAIEDSQQLTTTGSAPSCSAIKIADGIVAIFHGARDWPLIYSYIETRSIAADGTIGAVIDGPDIWGRHDPSDSGGHYDMRPFHVTGTIYACSYREATSSDGWVDTFDIAADGTITTASVDSFEYETVKVNRFPVGACGGGIAIFFYPDNDDYGQAKTVDIDGSGNVGASVLDTETVDGVFSDYTHIIKVTSRMFIVVWSDTSYSGQAASLSITPVAVIKGNPNIDQLMYQHVDRMGR